MFLDVFHSELLPFLGVIEAVVTSRFQLRFHGSMGITVSAIGEIRASRTGTWLLRFPWHRSSKKKTRMLLLDFCKLYSSDVITTLDGLPFLQSALQGTGRDAQGDGSLNHRTEARLASVSVCDHNRSSSSHYPLLKESPAFSSPGLCDYSVLIAFNLNQVCFT